MTVFAKMLQIALDASGVNQTELSEKTGISKGAISSYVNGYYEPKQKNTFLIAKALGVTEAFLMGFDDTVATSTPPITSPDILPPTVDRALAALGKLNGRAQGRVAEYAEDLTASLKNLNTDDPKDYLTTVYVRGRAAAGQGATNYDYYPDEFDRRIVWTEDVPPHDSAVEVVGDSMAPLIMDGDIAYISTQSDYIDGHIYALSINGETVIKSLAFAYERLTVKSVNEAYADRVLTGSDLADVRIIGRVVGWGPPVREDEKTES